MVKNYITIIISIFLLTIIFILDEITVTSSFSQFKNALSELYTKIENETANHEDGKAIRILWKDKKQKLQIWIPLTSIETIDYQLNEALGYLYEYKYESALPEIEALIEISEQMPCDYTFSFKNIF